MNKLSLILRATVTALGSLVYAGPFNYTHTFINETDRHIILDLYYNTCENDTGNWLAPKGEIGSTWERNAKLCCLEQINVLTHRAGDNDSNGKPIKYMGAEYKLDSRLGDSANNLRRVANKCGDMIFRIQPWPYGNDGSKVFVYREK